MDVEVSRIIIFGVIAVVVGAAAGIAVHYYCQRRKEQDLEQGTRQAQRTRALLASLARDGAAPLSRPPERRQAPSQQPTAPSNERSSPSRRGETRDDANRSHHGADVELTSSSFGVDVEVVPTTSSSGARAAGPTGGNDIEISIPINSADDLPGVHAKIGQIMEEKSINRDSVIGEPNVTFVSAAGKSCVIHTPEDLESVAIPGHMVFIFKITADRAAPIDVGTHAKPASWKTAIAIKTKEGTDPATRDSSTYAQHATAFQQALVDTSAEPFGGKTSMANNIEIVIPVNVAEELQTLHGTLSEKMQAMDIDRDHVCEDPVVTFVAADGKMLSVSGPEDLENVALPGQFKYVFKLKYSSGQVP